MLKKKEIEKLLSNHIEVANELYSTRKEIINQDLDFEERRKKLEELASKEELNDFAISLLRYILE